MLSLYLLRHGQTDCGKRGVYCGGDCDAALDETGRHMAVAAATHLAELKLDAIYSSPQRRARETVELAARALRLPVHPVGDLRELSYGAWDGQSPPVLQREAPRDYAEWLRHPASMAPPGGETGAQAAARLRRALARIRAEHPDGRVLLAGHKTTHRLLLCSLLGVDLELYRARFAQPLCGLSLVTFHRTGPRLDRLADLSFLPPELRDPVP